MSQTQTYFFHAMQVHFRLNIKVIFKFFENYLFLTLQFNKSKQQFHITTNSSKFMGTTVYIGLTNNVETLKAKFALKQPKYTEKSIANYSIKDFFPPSKTSTLKLESNTALTGRTNFNIWKSYYILPLHNSFICPTNISFLHAFIKFSL